VNVGILAVVLVRRRQLVLDRRLRRRVPRMLVAAVAMAAVLWALEAALYPVSGGIARFAALGMLIGAGMVTYFGVAQIIGGLDLRDALRMLKRRSG
jgi:putative peptidoglycan lipid II flippase